MSTASLRASMPPNGVLTDAVAHSQPAATFGSGGTRVEVLRVDNGAPTSKPPSPAAPAFGGQLAARLAGATDPDVLAVLQSRTVDQRVLATLAVIAATQPVRVEGRLRDRESHRQRSWYWRKGWCLNPARIGSIGRTY